MSTYAHISSRKQMNAANLLRFVFAYPTPNVFQGVTNSLMGVVLHHTGGTFAGAMAQLTNADAKYRASAHLVIAEDGTRIELAPAEAVTWHAGPSAWPSKGLKSLNFHTYGIEFVGDTTRAPLTQQQVDSFAEWWSTHGKALGFAAENDLTDHRCIAVPAGRKVDLDPEEFHRCLKAAKAAEAPKKTKAQAPSTEPTEPTETT